MAGQPSLDCITVSTPATISSSASVSPRSSCSDWEVSGSQLASHTCSCASPCSPLDLSTPALFDIDDEYPIIPGVSDSFDFNFKSWPWSEPLISDDMLHPSLDSFEPTTELYTSPTCYLNSSFPPWGEPQAASNSTPSQFPAHNFIEDEMLNATRLEDEGTSPRTISSVSSDQSLGKRNSVSEADSEPSDESTKQSPAWAKKKHGKMSRATAHNLVEKKYRSNLNEKMLALRDSIPSLKMAAESAFLEGGRQEPSRKLNKAYILTEAKDYIVYLKKRNESLSRKEKDLEARVKAFQMLSRSKYGKKWAM